MRRAWLLSAGLLGCTLIVNAAGAEIYKSVDEHGNVVFSQQHPKGSQSTVVAPKYSHATTAPATNGTPAPSTATPAAAKPAGAKLTAEQLAAKQENCANAKNEIAQFKDRRTNRLQYVNEQGERAYLTPEVLQSRIADAEEEIKKNCDEE